MSRFVLVIFIYIIADIINGTHEWTSYMRMRLHNMTQVHILLGSKVQNIEFNTYGASEFLEKFKEMYQKLKIRLN